MNNAMVMIVELGCSGSDIITIDVLWAVEDRLERSLCAAAQQHKIGVVYESVNIDSLRLDFSKAMPEPATLTKFS